MPRGVIWSPLVCCGIRTTLMFEIVRVAWLDAAGLGELASRRAGIEEAGWIVPGRGSPRGWDGAPA